MLTAMKCIAVHVPVFVWKVDLLPSNSWVDPLFWLGCQQTLEKSDLFVHPQEADSVKLLQRFNRWVVLYTSYLLHINRLLLITDKLVQSHSLSLLASLSRWRVFSASSAR